MSATNVGRVNYLGYICGMKMLQCISNHRKSLASLEIELGITKGRLSEIISGRRKLTPPEEKKLFTYLEGLHKELGDIVKGYSVEGSSKVNEAFDHSEAFDPNSISVDLEGFFEPAIKLESTIKNAGDDLCKPKKKVIATSKFKGERKIIRDNSPLR